MPLRKTSRKRNSATSETDKSPSSQLQADSHVVKEMLSTGGEEYPLRTRKKKRKISAKSEEPPERAVVKVEKEQKMDTFPTQLGKPLLQALTSHHYLRPTPVQEQTLPLTLEGTDLIAVAATGSGKTCAFILPILVRISARTTRSPPRKPQKSATSSIGSAPEGAWTCSKCGNVNWPQRTTCNTRTCKAPRPEGSTQVSKAVELPPASPLALVLAPTRELAQQIHVETCRFSPAVDARVACIYGGVPKGEQAGTLTGKGADIVIATPGRCVDFLAPDRFLGHVLSVEKVECLVLDEADRMLEAGFFPLVKQIIACRPASKVWQTLFFTATWPCAVQEAARDVVRKSAKEVMVEQRGQLGELTAHTGIVQRLEVLDYHAAKFERLVQILNSDLKAGGTCLVFCKTQKRCDWLAKKLEEQCELMWIGGIHAGKDQHTREELLAKFRSLSVKGNDQKGILVATNLAARGLDIPGVHLVIVFDFTSVENYVHQIGRTGRAGASGAAMTFYVAGDGDAKELVSVFRNSKQKVPPKLVEIADSEVQKPQRPSEDNGSHEAELNKARQGWKDAKWAKERRQGARIRKGNHLKQSKSSKKRQS